MTRVDVAVVGGGLGGLAVAHFAQRGGAQVAVVERGDRPGGRVCTTREDGFVVELGPLGWLDREPAAAEMAEQLGLEMLAAEAVQKRRWLHKDGRLQELPSGPGSFLTTPLLPVSGKLRFFCEPFIRARREGEESIQDFARRRFGRPMADTFFAAMVSGIFGGDPERLSMHACFPLLAGWEEQSGSVVAGAIKHMRAKKKAVKSGARRATSGALSSFRGGMAELVDAAAAALGDGWMPGTAVDAVRLDGEDWVISADGAELLRARAVVLATPARTSAALLGAGAVDATGVADAGALPEAAGLAAAAEGIGRDSLSVATFAFPAERVRADLGGFGFIALRGEGFRPLGVQYAHSIFPAQTPAGMVQLRVMLGGAFDPQAVDLDDAELQSEALDPLRGLLSIEGEPERVWLQRVPGGIPQYRMGHLDRVATFAAAERAHPGLHFAGDALHGVGINAVVKRSAEVAAALPARS
jgi:oxygen-dependent protoporphyrinogen oxidase